jgi:hypothetical protein
MGRCAAHASGRLIVPAPFADARDPRLSPRWTCSPSATRGRNRRRRRLPDQPGVTRAVCIPGTSARAPSPSAHLPLHDLGALRRNKSSKLPSATPSFRTPARQVFGSLSQELRADTRKECELRLHMMTNARLPTYRAQMRQRMRRWTKPGGPSPPPFRSQRRCDQLKSLRVIRHRPTASAHDQRRPIAAIPRWLSANGPQSIR